MEQFQIEKRIWTVGHSTRTFEAFLNLLKGFEIEVLVDVRRYPGSKKYPHFNAAELERSLTDSGISYLPIPELGGRRKPKPNSKNTAWRNEAFRGYADYTETSAFATAIGKLTGIATLQNCAFMCSEAVWWRCHRSIISDYLKERAWKVLHIMNEHSAIEHPYTSAYLEMKNRTR